VVAFFELSLSTFIYIYTIHIFMVSSSSSRGGGGGGGGGGYFFNNFFFVGVFLF
jgi:hypothetical protein